jgi:redox-sensitive bicupin YhaK (pirin superfamily)
MIEHRPFNKLAGVDHGWLKAKHHFSFADYDDPARMGWGSLRIWNDDEIAPNTGFPPHPHANMEIITYVREEAAVELCATAEAAASHRVDSLPRPSSPLDTARSYLR